MRRTSRAAPPRDAPLVTVRTQANRRVLDSVDAAARAAGLRPGMAAAHAQALLPSLHLADATPEADTAALDRLGLWCMRYAPLVTSDPPDGIFIDIAGAAHLFGGEAGLLDDLAARLHTAQLTAKLALADTPGCAWAVARYGPGGVVGPGQMAEALGSLPVAALRLLPKQVASLHDVGIERIAQLASKPHPTLRLRFGQALTSRLGQALGAAPEPLVSLQPPDVPQVTLRFAEPVSEPADLQRIIAALCAKLVTELERRGIGARRLDLVFLRVDRIAQAVRIGTARPSRDAKHLGKLLGERLVLVDPGFGIEETTLTASWVEALTERQTLGRHVADEDGAADLAGLIDALRVRLGPSRVFRLSRVESEYPERAVTKVSPVAEPRGTTWPADLPRPARLFNPPEPVTAIAEIPDAPPLFFVWRRIRHRVVKADGPERVTGEWWRDDAEAGTRRDYYRVENAEGERFWLFRDAPAEAGGRWWLHGLGEA